MNYKFNDFLLQIKYYEGIDNNLLKEGVKLNYYIADMHLFCNSQTQAGVNYDGRPFANVEEMNAHFLSRWNAKVTNSDTVYILGDVAFRGNHEQRVRLVSQLKGRKILVKGNHDDLSDYRYAKLFEKIVDYKEMSDGFRGKTYKLVLSHYPILMWNGQHKGTILLYGHTHNTLEDSFFQDCIAKMNESDDLSLHNKGGKEIRAINVGACMPWMNYEPRTLKEIVTAVEG